MIIWFICPFFVLHNDWEHYKCGKNSTGKLYFFPLFWTNSICRCWYDKSLKYLKMELFLNPMLFSNFSWLVIYFLLCFDPPFNVNQSHKQWHFNQKGIFLIQWKAAMQFDNELLMTNNVCLQVAPNCYAKKKWWTLAEKRWTKKRLWKKKKYHSFMEGKKKIKAKIVSYLCYFSAKNSQLQTSSSNGPAAILLGYTDTHWRCVVKWKGIELICMVNWMRYLQSSLIMHWLIILSLNMIECSLNSLSHLISFLIAFTKEKFAN